MSRMKIEQEIIEQSNNRLIELRINKPASFIAIASAKLKDYSQLAKFRLTSLVVFSSAIGFLMGANGNWIWPQMILFLAAGFLVTASSNAINQVIEKDYDRLMSRTMNRPL